MNHSPGIAEEIQTFLEILEKVDPSKQIPSFEEAVAIGWMKENHLKYLRSLLEENERLVRVNWDYLDKLQRLDVQRQFAELKLHQTWEELEQVKEERDQWKHNYGLSYENHKTLLSQYKEADTSEK